MLQLGKEGFAVPVKACRAQAWSAGLDPLPISQKVHGGSDSQVCSWAHFLNMMWQPLLNALDSLMAHGEMPK